MDQSFELRKFGGQIWLNCGTFIANLHANFSILGQPKKLFTGHLKGPGRSKMFRGPRIGYTWYKASVYLSIYCPQKQNSDILLFSDLVPCVFWRLTSCACCWSMRSAGWKRFPELIRLQNRSIPTTFRRTRTTSPVLWTW